MHGNMGLHEALKLKVAAVAAVYAAGTYNNGLTGTQTNGIDARGYEEALVILNVGAVAAAHTLDVSIYHNDVNSTTGAVALTDTAGTAQAFAQVVDGGNESAVMVGRIQTKNAKRYIFVRAVVVGASGVAFSVELALGKAKAEPVAQDIAVAFKHL